MVSLGGADVLGSADVLGVGRSVAVGIGSRVVVVIGTWGTGGADFVVGVAVADVVCVGGAATVASLDELLTTTSANTSPVTSSAAAPAAILSLIHISEPTRPY